MTTIQSSDRFSQRQRALLLAFQKTNRILMMDRKITVEKKDLGQIPGGSTYPDIYLNLDLFPELHDKREMVRLLGLNYHELSHLMFSPRLFKAVLPADLHDAYNILEDQRIESFFTAIYEPAGKFFTEMAVKFLLGDDRYWPVHFLFTYGRSFMPLEIRDEFEARFILPTRTKNKAKRLINEYKGFVTDTFRPGALGHGRLIEVIEEFKAILDRAYKELGLHDTPQGCGGGDPGNSGQPDREKEKEARSQDRRRREQEEETGEDQSGFWDEDAEDEEDEPSESDDQGESDAGEESDEEGEEDGSGDSEGEADDDSDDDAEGGSATGSGDDDSDSDDSDEDGSGEGNDGSEGEGDSDGESDTPVDEDSEGGPSGNSGEVGDFSNKELRQYLRDIAEAVVEDGDVTKEINTIHRSMYDLSNLDVFDFDYKAQSEESIPVGVADTLKKVTEDFRRLYAQVEPGWKYGSDHGRLNVGRAMSDPENYDEHFDEWDEGREHESGLEVVISVDLSGSLGYKRAMDASRSLWIIKRACDEVGAKTTVFGFHRDTLGLYGRDQVAPTTVVPLYTDLGGSTMPCQSFHLARRILNNSDMPNKLFVTITDGGWFASVDPDTGIFMNESDLIDSIDAIKMYVGLGAGGSRGNMEAQRRFHHRAAIENAEDIAPLVKAVIETMLRERVGVQ